MTGAPADGPVRDEVRRTPAVSVCVATYRRPGPLRRLLGRLSELEVPDGGFEVVVVDDGSPASDGVTEVLAAEEAAGRLPLRWLSLPSNAGRAAARNAAWRQAGGAWIAFTDDDCRPEPKWLIRLVEACDASAPTDRVAVVQGRVVPDPERVDLLGHPLARSLRVDSLSGYYETANIAYRRDVLERVGGFDESFPGAGEDTDLGWRVRQAGFGAAFAPDAVVVHDVVVRTFGQDLRDRRRWGDVVRVVKRHPETRRMAWHPLVFRRSHVEPIVVLAGLPLLLLGPGWRTLSAAAMSAVAARRIRGARTPGDVARRLQLLVGDLYEVGVLTRSSVRHRTVLL